MTKNFSTKDPGPGAVMIPAGALTISVDLKTGKPMLWLNREDYGNLGRNNGFHVEDYHRASRESMRLEQAKLEIELERAKNAMVKERAEFEEQISLMKRRFKMW